MKTEDARTWVLEGRCIYDRVIFHTRIVTGHNWYRRGSNPPSQYVKRKHSCLTCLACGRHLSQCCVRSSPVTVLCALVTCLGIGCTRQPATLLCALITCYSVVCTCRLSQCCVHSSPVSVLCALVTCLSDVCTRHLLTVMFAFVTCLGVGCTRHLPRCCVHLSPVTVLCALVTCLSAVCIKKGTVLDE